MIAANIRAVSRLLDAIRIWCPRPEPAPAHSANTAPITATAIAILVPLKKNGRAEGSSTRVRICLRLAPSVRIIVISCGSTERSPSSVLTVTGKKQTSAISSTFGPSPKPNQTIRIGAMATGGMVCEATSSG